MKYLLFLLLTSCSMPLSGHSAKWRESHRTRITYYTGNKEKVAVGGRAVEGRSIAASPKIPFGTKIEIPALMQYLGDTSYTVDDRGPAVTSMKASEGLAPVLDIFVATKKKLEWLKRVAPEYMEATL